MMGMFDEIKCEYPLSDAPAEIQSGTFQTKDLHNLLDKYTITYEGRLIHHSTEWYPVEEKDRPYYGKPEWDTNPIVRMFGCLKAKLLGDIDTNYHGILNIYTLLEEDWFEYRIKFTNGKVESVERINELWQGNN